MKEVKYTCDRCGSVIAGNPVIITFFEEDRETGELSAEGLPDEQRGMGALHFCACCAEAAARTAVSVGQRKKPAAKAPEALPEIPALMPEEKRPEPMKLGRAIGKAPKGRSPRVWRIDPEEVCALYDSGNSPEDIAEELGVGAQAVRRRLAELEEEGRIEKRGGWRW